MKFLKIAALFAALGVSLGAFGAHALHDRLEEAGRLDAWKTAVFYHLIHSLALFALAMGQRVEMKRLVETTAWLWIAGIVLFSGSLYGLSLTGWSFLGPVTPLGGLCFLGGWVSLLFIKQRAA